MSHCQVIVIDESGKKKIGIGGFGSVGRKANLANLVHCGDARGQISALKARENHFSALSPTCITCRELEGRSCSDFI